MLPRTTSGNFPTADPVQAQYGGGLSDAFATKLNSDRFCACLLNISRRLSL